METNTTSQSNVVEIDLLELLGELWRNLSILILATLIGALLGYLAGKTVITPTYSSTTKIYVRASDEQNNSVNTTDLQASALLTKDYEQIIKSREVTETVIARLQLKLGEETMTHEQLIEKMSVNTPDDTRVVSITITDTDPYIAADIANAIRDVAMEQIENVMGTESVKIVDEANIPTTSNSMSASRLGMMAGMAFFAIAAVLIIVVHLTNNTIRTTEDIERYLGLSTLGVIPLSNESLKSKRKRGKRA